MTRNQIAYQQHLETIRSNRAREDETNRANLAKERETSRSNRAQESLSAQSNQTNRDAMLSKDAYYQGKVQHYNRQDVIGGVNAATSGFKNLVDGYHKARYGRVEAIGKLLGNIL